VLNTQVLKGLQYIHNVLGFTHSNLSLSNIHIMEDGSVKIGS
jgi:serine/threonine protein kinase